MTDNLNTEIDPAIRARMDELSNEVLSTIFGAGTSMDELLGMTQIKTEKDNATAREAYDVAIKTMFDPKMSSLLQGYFLTQIFATAYVQNHAVSGARFALDLCKNVNGICEDQVIPVMISANLHEPKVLQGKKYELPSDYPYVVQTVGIQYLVSGKGKESYMNLTEVVQGCVGDAGRKIPDTPLSKARRETTAQFMMGLTTGLNQKNDELVEIAAKGVMTLGDDPHPFYHELFAEAGKDIVAYADERMKTDPRAAGRIHLNLGNISAFSNMSILDKMKSGGPMEHVLIDTLKQDEKYNEEEFKNMNMVDRVMVAFKSVSNIIEKETGKPFGVKRQPS